jgi:hypothetical protein
MSETVCSISKKWKKFGNKYAVPSNSMHAKAVLNSDLSRMRGAPVCTNLSVTTVKKLRLAEFKEEIMKESLDLGNKSYGPKN